MKNYSLSEKSSGIIVCAIVAAIAILSVSDGSLWGDEICRVVAPISGSLSATMDVALGYAQPGYMLYIFLWNRLVGSTELLLRYSNLPFAAIALFFAFKIVKSRNWSPWWTLAFFAHPMFAYYMNEATPYIIVYALSLAFTYYLFCVEDFQSRNNLIRLHLIYLTGVFIHFMFGFIFTLYVTKALLSARNQKKLLFGHLKIMLRFSPFYLVLLGVYLTSLRGTHTGFGVKSVLYIPYAFLGMQGAGLSRNDLRAGNFEKIQAWQCAALALFLLTLILLLRLAVKDGRRLVRNNHDILLAIAAFFAVILPVSAIVQLGLWERHCMTVFPAYMICACDFLRHLLSRPKARALLVSYWLLLAVSSFNIAFNYYYSCDDIKGMTQEVAASLQENPDLTVVVSDTFDYYSYPPDFENQVFILPSTQLDEMRDYVSGLGDKEFLLVLFEKGVSRQAYHYYDNQDGYLVDNRYNSFKLISRRS